MGDMPSLADVEARLRHALGDDAGIWLSSDPNAIKETRLNIRVTLDGRKYMASYAADPTPESIAYGWNQLVSMVEAWAKQRHTGEVIDEVATHGDTEHATLTTAKENSHG